MPHTNAPVPGLASGGHRRPRSDEVGRLQVLVELFGHHIVDLITGEPRHSIEVPRMEERLLSILRALLGQSRVLLLDGPTVGMSPDEVLDTMCKIDAAREALGLTVLVATENVQIVNLMPRRALAFDAGRLLSDMPHAVSRPISGRRVDWMDD